MTKSLSDTSAFANERVELPSWLNPPVRVRSTCMPRETHSRTVATTKKAASWKYALHIPTALDRRLKRCREAVRTAIRTQLQEIADGAGNTGKVKLLRNGAPGLRFYIHESYKVSYEVDAKGRRVVLLDLSLVTP